MDATDVLLALAMGVGLAAACGFRVFTPLFVMSLAARGGYMSVAGNVGWVQSDVALIALGAATALEIGAYYVPWLDNALDSIATPAAGIAGTLAASSLLTGMDPAMQWSLGAIAGGGTALSVQGLTVGARALSSATTGGMGNGAVSTAEAGAATGLSIIAIAWPLLAVAIVFSAMFWIGRFVLRRYRRRRALRAAA